MMSKIKMCFTNINLIFEEYSILISNFAQKILFSFFQKNFLYIHLYEKIFYTHTKF